MKLLKDSTVAIAIQTSDRENIFFMGTGFFIKEGFIVTTRDLLDRCLSFAKSYKKQFKKNFEIVAYHKNPNNEYVNPDIIYFSNIKASYTEFLNKYSPKNEKFGHLGLLLPSNIKTFPYLEIKETQSNIFDKICLCGYPNGDQTMDLTKRYRGLRFSPVIQFGIINGLMPTDETTVPYGIQTDLIGSSCSIGSPIVDIFDGRVVGIVQGVLKSTIYGKLTLTMQNSTKRNEVMTNYYGTVELGLLYGVELHKFYSHFNKVYENYKKGISKTPLLIETVEVELIKNSEIGVKIE